MYEFKIGNGTFEFKSATIADPIPTARQIIEAAGFQPAEEYLVFEVCSGRQLKEFELDQTTDSLEHSEKIFLIFKSDQSWRGSIDGKRFEWGAPFISGRDIKWLAGIEPEKEGIWWERRDEPDLLISDNSEIDFSHTGIERFRTGQLIQLCIEGKLFPWSGNTITTEKIAELGGWDASEGVIIVDFENNERDLLPSEVIELKPGLSFGKKLRFKRG